MMITREEKSKTYKFIKRVFFSPEVSICLVNLSSNLFESYCRFSRSMRALPRNISSLLEKIISITELSDE
jgi:hypothetical protein